MLGSIYWVRKLCKSITLVGHLTRRSRGCSTEKRGSAPLASTLGAQNDYWVSSTQVSELWAVVVRPRYAERSHYWGHDRRHGLLLDRHTWPTRAWFYAGLVVYIGLVGSWLSVLWNLPWYPLSKELLCSLFPILNIWWRHLTSP